MTQKTSQVYQCQEIVLKQGKKYIVTNMKRKNRSYNMLNDISFKDIHMCRINLTHTICIWGNHIFDSNFEKTLPLNLECLLICRSIGMPDDFIDTV